jgi:hypothetical protein
MFIGGEMKLTMAIGEDHSTTYLMRGILQVAQVKKG